MKGILNKFGYHSVYILGAGFSKPFGLPLTKELLPLIYELAKTKPWYIGNVKKSKFGQADLLVEELQHYYPTLKVTHKNFKIKAKNVDIEELLSLIAASSFFIENTSEKWDDHGSKVYSWIKKWIAEIIWEKQTQLDSSQITLLDRFVQNLDQCIVLTFNWDTLLEQAFERNKIKYSYDLDQGIKHRCNVILKLHGSIDWFKPREFN